MADLERIKNLSPEQLRLLKKRLRAKKEAAGESPVPVAAAPAGSSPSLAPPPLVAGPPRREAPLTFQQTRLWFLEQLESGGAFYNNPGALSFAGALDAGTLRRAIAELGRRQETLRTIIAVGDDGEPVQRLVERWEPPLTVISLAALDPERRRAEARRRARAEARRPFDLEAGPLARFTLLRLGPREHWLLFTLHHVIADAWAMRRLQIELLELYAAAAAGRPPRLPALPLQYADFARWQRGWLRGAVLERLLEAGRERLRGAPPLLELPLDRPRPPRQSFRGATLAETFSPALAGRLHELGQKHRATLFVVLTAGFKALLARLTDQHDLVVGAPMAYRDHGETANLIGFFANTLVLRSDLGGRPSFAEVLERVRESTAAALEQQHLPFEKLVEVLQPERSLSHSPIFQVAFSMLNLPAARSGGGSGEASSGGAGSGGTRSEALESGRGSAVYDLVLYAAEGPAGITMSLEYATDLFDASTARRLLGHWRELLGAAADDPTTPLGALPLVSAAERHQALVEWNDTRIAARPDGLAERFAVQAALRPEAVAVIAAHPDPALEKSLTYGELERRANRLAHHLRALGAGPETRVGIAIERSLEMAVGILGIVKSGAAWVPLDPSYPAERLAYLVEDAGLELLVTVSALREAVPAAGVPRVELDADAGAIDARPATAPSFAASDADAAYVIYTSGSTGRPKGIVVSRGAVANHMRWMGWRCPLGPSDAVLFQTALSFDAAVSDFFASLLDGATLVLARPGAERDLGELVATVRRHEIVALGMVSPVLAYLLAEPGFDECRSLRRVICGGEALAPELMDRFLESFDGELINMYGPAEATIEATAWTCEAGRGLVPIGRPIDNARALIVDRELRPRPLGIVGELCLGGAGLARGYLKRPRLTAERFVPDPTASFGERLYRSGDLARALADGNLLFLGRIDDQVKVRGFRIELEEIEAVLARHPAVGACAVVVEGEGELRRLAAWVSPRAGAVPESEDLARHLARRLPDYMVPQSFGVLDELPLTPNDKVDREALVRLVPARDEATHEPPRGEIEEKVAAIWSELLAAERVGRGDDFFALGGHSLLATRVTSRLRRDLGVEVPVRTLFENSTVAGLAKAVESLADRHPASRGAASRPPLLPLPRPDDPRAVVEGPLSFAQERLWFLDQVDPGNPFYNLTTPVRLHGPLEPARLERALELLVERHESLRTTFAYHGGRPWQQVAARARVRLPRIDLAALPEERRDATLRRLVEGEFKYSFDLAHGPLLRVLLIRLDDGDHVLSINMHHVVTDGWSMGIVVRELVMAYGAVLSGSAPAWPPLPVQYLDFATWQRRWLEGGELERQLEHWRAQLEGVPPLELPVDRPRPPLPRQVGAVHKVSYGEALARGLTRFAEARNATHFMAVLALWESFLGRLCGQRDFAVGTPIANRNQPEIENLVGFFVNTLALRADLDSNLESTAAGAWPSFDEVTARVRRRALAAQDHQDLPFQKLVEELDGGRDPAITPLFQVMLVLDEAARGPAGPAGRRELPGGLTVEAVEGEIMSSKFELTLLLRASDRGLGGFWVYRRDLFDATTVARFASSFETLLEAALKRPADDIAALPLLPPAARHQLLREWNSGPGYAGGGLLHEMVLEAAARRPDALAVLAAGRDFESTVQALTHGELRERVLELAARLAALGVGPEERVGIFLERSPELVIALVAVLAAGGVYVPLDPAYPQERLAFLLDDAAPAVVLTSAELRPRLPEESGRTVLEIGGGAGDSGSLSLGERAGVRVPSPDNAAYVIYTSGSTGQPKGVVISHRAVVDRMRWAMAYEHDPEVCYLHKASISFDVSLAEIFGPLAAGARLVLAPPGGEMDAAGLARLIRAHGVTHVSFPPILLTTLLGKEEFTSYGGLRQLISGGETVLPELAERYLATATQPAEMQNRYGPTEATISMTLWKCRPRTRWERRLRTLPIGRPIGRSAVYLLDRRLRPLPLGASGEIVIGGPQLSRGYWRRPGQSAASLVPDPFTGAPGERLYRTGDLGRWRADGALEHLGRLDQQIKLRGFRVELGEIEAALEDLPEIARAAVTIRQRSAGVDVVAHVVAAAPLPPHPELRRALRRRLPEHMLPGYFAELDALPLTPNGKIDRRALARRPLPAAVLETVSGRATGQATAVVPRPHAAGAEEAFIADAWRRVLQLDAVGPEDNFFDLGGHSLLLVEVHKELGARWGDELALLDLFRFPTVRGLAEHLRGIAPASTTPLTAPEASTVLAPASPPQAAQQSTEIAIVGFGGRFPGARDLEEFWRNLCDGVESIAFYDDDELRAAGVDDETLADPRYVKAQSVLEDAELFDADFFGYAPREAQIIDPQQRLFLEVAWEALEHAGYDPARFPGRTAVFAGVGMNNHVNRLAADPRLLRAVGSIQAMIGNAKDFLPTRVSYKLDLRGPSVNVQTACSTSLVATVLCCEALLQGRVEMALAGGVSVAVGPKRGYIFEAGGISSPDGHTRSFDARAGGTVRGHGAGIVVLKRLADAERDGDTIHAVIKGFALNNDGSGKIGFTAPSVQGQAQVIAEAQRSGGVDPRTVDYVEAHGTATELGDPIEVSALIEAWKTRLAELGEAAASEEGHETWLGSIKSNLGHLDTAAGVAGLIKTALALEHRQIPPSLHFESPNPAIDFAGSPFRVAAALQPWEAKNGAPRRAGVSAFGIGGTNAHVVLEEAPAQSAAVMRDDASPWQLLVLAARTPSALEAATGRLANHLEERPEHDLADVAFTLQVGRQRFAERRFLVCRDREDAREALRERDPERLVDLRREATRQPVIFLFPGGGAQYPNMGRGLYESEPVYRQAIDHCADLAAPRLGYDLRHALFPPSGEEEEAAAHLRRPSYAMSTIFATSYALARLWLSWGLVPRAMIGHSLGEYAAATVAGALELEDALALVALRSQLFETMPEGAMLGVPLGAEELADELGDDLDLAVVNTPSLSVVSGTAEAVERLAVSLEERGVEVSRLHVRRAGHSRLTEPILPAFGELAATVSVQAPRIPFVSNVSGTWMSEAELRDPGYWPRHMRSTVRFSAGLEEIFALGESVLLEVGPGQTLCTLARQHPAIPEGTIVSGSLRHPRQEVDDNQHLAAALGRLWQAGVEIDWPAYHESRLQSGQRRRVPLPTYPFERQSFALAPLRGAGRRRARDAADAKDSLPMDSVELAVPLSTPAAAGRPRELPQGPLEERLAALWSELLGVAEIGRHDDYFELGGSSLLALRLRSRLQEEFGVDPGPDYLFAAPTVARLARRLAEAGVAEDGEDQEGAAADAADAADQDKAATAPRAAASSCLVALQPGDESGRLPLFLVHPVGGDVYFYREIAAEIGKELTVYGIRARGLERGEKPYETIEAMAAHYVETLRERQPTGPYRIGGSSFGGVVAFEMAQQLAAAGQEVPFLGLLDAVGQGQMPRRLEDDAEIILWLLRGRLPDITLEALREREPSEQVRWVLEEGRKANLYPADTGFEDLERLLSTVRSNIKALFAYEPRPYPGSLVFFRAEERQEWDPPHPERAWVDFARGGIEIHVVPGGHITMHHAPHHGRLAQVMRRHLLAPLPAG